MEIIEPYFVWLFIIVCWVYLLIRGIIIPTRRQSFPGKTTIIKITSTILFFVLLLFILGIVNSSILQFREYSLVISFWLYWGWGITFTYYLFTISAWLEQIRWKDKKPAIEEKEFFFYKENKKLIHINTFLIGLFALALPITLTVTFMQMKKEIAFTKTGQVQSLNSGNPFLFVLFYTAAIIMFFFTLLWLVRKRKLYFSEFKGKNNKFAL